MMQPLLLITESEGYMHVQMPVDLEPPELELLAAVVLAACKVRGFDLERCLAINIGITGARTVLEPVVLQGAGTDGS